MKTVAPAPAGAPRPPPRPPRMTLASVSAHREPAPDRIFVMGVEGVGKSTFGRDAPHAVFLSSEDGIRHLDPQPAAFPEPESWADVLEAVATLATEKHAYRTLVLDTVDWLEPFAWQHVCQANQWDSIEAPGYGKGYTAALDEWRRLIVGLDRARAAGMQVVLLAHAATRTVSPPDSDHDWTRYECKLHRGAAALLREWCDVCLFATYEQWAAKKKGSTRAKGVSSGRRVAYSQYSAAYDAKSRWPLPESFTFSWEEYAAARASGGANQVGQLRAEVAELRGKIAVEGDQAKSLDAWIAKAGDDPARLRKVVDGLRGKVAEQAPGEEE